MMRPDHRRPGGKVVEVDVERFTDSIRWRIIGGSDFS